MKIILISLFNLLFSLSMVAQFGTAPDFTVTDIDGTDFHLYEELDSGKPVILACMATWSEVSFNFHSQYFLEELHQDYGPNGTDQIRILCYEGDANTTLQDLTGVAGNTLGNWTSNVSYPIVNETNLQLPLDIFAVQGFPSVMIIDPENYEITSNVSCAQSTSEIRDSLNTIITLFEDTGADFNLAYNSSDITCFQANNGEIELNISGGFLPYQIEWFDNSPDTTKENLLPGEYAVTITDALGNSLSENIMITEPPILEITNSTVLSETSNQQNGSISLVVEGGTLPYSFEWNTGSNNLNLVGLENGNYSITISDANLCEIVDTFFVDMTTEVTKLAAIEYLLFPNPTFDRLQIVFSKAVSGSYQVTDCNGSVLLESGLERELSLDLSGFGRGVYTLLFYLGNGVFVERVVRL